MTLTSDHIMQASIFFEDVRDTVYVAEFILDMSECFPNVNWLISLAQWPSKLVRSNINLYARATFIDSPIFTCRK